MRLGCCLVIMSLLLGLALPPKAEAFVLTGTAVAAIAGGFLAACGLPLLVKGMNESGLTDSIGQLLQEWLDVELGGVSVENWFQSFGEAGLTIATGKLIFSRDLANNLVSFAQWVAGKYGTQPGVNQVFGEIGNYVMLQDGSKFYISVLDSSLTLTVVGTQFFLSDLPIHFSNGSYIYAAPFEGSDVIRDVVFIFSEVSGNYSIFSYKQPFVACICYRSFDSRYPYCVAYSYDSKHFSYDSILTPSRFSEFFGDVFSVDESLALDVADTLTIPGELAEDQSIALDVGATGSMSIQDILQSILDAILAGDLSASAEVVEAEPEEPPEGEIEDIDGLGLPALGAALITRFPFSIPWDVAKGIQLLAAPPKAPYFEVDFLAPISDRVGGWKGSTKIVLDFSQFEILGQLSRWTSTVGFCLMLAGATKRFIWTA